jgi:hypothetical protein
VDNDGGSNYEKYYRLLLDSARIPYDISTVGGGALKNIVNLNDYDILIWFTGDARSNILGIGPVEIMQDYLDHGGRLFLTGQGIAKQLHTLAPDFLSAYLKTQYLSTSFVPILGASAGGEVLATGDSVLILGSGGANNQESPDHIAAINGGVPELAYFGGTDLGAVSYTGDYQVVFFSFGFEAITKGSTRWMNRDSVYTEILKYFGYLRPPGYPRTTTLSITPGELTHMLDHTPTFAWGYSDPGSLPQQSYQIQVTGDRFWQTVDQWDSGPMAGAVASAVYAGPDLIDGETYYIRVRTYNGQFWSDWKEGSMRMNSVPVATGLNPDHGQKVTDTVPTLSHATMIEGEDDSLTYAYELYADSQLTTLVAQAQNQLPGTGATTSWQVPVPLARGEDYYWRVRATDKYETGAWTEAASLVVATYACGDANGDWLINVGDAVMIINYVFKGGQAPDPLAAGDANDDGNVNVGDGVYLINFVFKSGPLPCCL